MTAPWQAIVEDLHGALAPAGLDLVGATTCGAYDASLSDAERARFALPCEAADRLVVCVGNTKALWPALVSAASRDAELARTEHPVDDYARAVVERAAEAVARAHGVELRVIAAPEIGPPAIALARLGVASGLGHVAPCHLLVHPVHGPWVGLRAAVVVDIAGPAVAAADPSPCESCATKPCLDAYETAVSASGGDGAVTRESLAREYPLWLRIRLVCPVGQASRYPDDQAEYHYTKRRAALPFGAHS
ncbi:MAG: hypothetical protein H5U40_12700 [Polyangiaceae bacterium]|nr:hypothetical protein [Polyangiaceae bacterium]